MHRFVRLLGGSLGVILAIALTGSGATDPLFDRTVAGYLLLPSGWWPGSSPATR